jgi:hypothetical protein
VKETGIRWVRVIGLADRRIILRQGPSLAWGPVTVLHGRCLGEILCLATAFAGVFNTVQAQQLFIFCCRGMAHRKRIHK